MSIKQIIKAGVLALSLILSAGIPGRCAIGTDGSGGDFTQWVMSDGLKRTFLVHLPKHHWGPLPLMLMFHGGGGTSLSFANKTHMNAVADSGGFIAVYPQGYRHQWNFGPGSRSSADDVAFVRRMLDYLESEYNIDRSKIYLAGFSEGGHMTERLTYEMPDKIATASMVCSLGLVALNQMYGAKHPPLPVILMFGTADPHQPYLGGSTEILGEPVMSGPATVDTWVRSDDCHVCTITVLPNVNHDDGSIVELNAYRGPGGNDVHFYKVLGGGHGWPGGIPGNPQSDGNTNEDFSASQAIWNFSLQHHK
jgi:polyhydroxybutyrate depolymerase